MTEQHTQGRLPGQVLLAEDGSAIYALGPDGFNTHLAQAQGEGREAFARALWYRWNAFEPGGAVAGMIEAARVVRDECSIDFTGPLYALDNLWAALAALTGEGQA